jgi:hypothetical protein
MFEFLTREVGTMVAFAVVMDLEQDNPFLWKSARAILREIRRPKTWKQQAATLTAIWAIYSGVVFGLGYIDMREPVGFRSTAIKHFSSGLGVIVAAPEFEELSDSFEHPTRSPFMIYENEMALGPAHSLHADIARLGHGRFSHWRNSFIFSSSDGTDPQTNGRIYRADRLDKPAPKKPATNVGPFGILRLAGVAVSTLSADATYDLIENAYDAPIDFGEFAIFLGLLGVSALLLLTKHSET